MSTVAALKLAELGRQREALRALYEETLSRAARAETPLARLAALHEGLLRARLGQTMLHPDVAQLKDILYTIPAGGPAPATVNALCERLTEEVERGRLRADYAWSFSSFLTEWTRSPNAGPEREEPIREDLVRSLLERWSRPAPSVDLSLIDEAFSFDPVILNTVQEKVRRFAEGEALEEKTPGAIHSIAEMLAASMYRRPSLRRSAEALANDDVQKAEFASAVTLVAARIAEWQWPAEGVPLRTSWTKTKWRPYLDEDLFTALLLQSLGNAFCSEIKSILEDHLPAHGGPLALDASDKRGDGFTGVVDQSFERGWLRDLADVESDSGRGFYDAADVSFESRYSLEDNLAHVNALIQVEPLTEPDRPLSVVRLDLEDLHLRVSHEAVLRVFEHLGVPPDWRTFFGRFMKAKIAIGGEIVENPVGVFPDHALSLLCIEAVMMALDLYVKRASGVRLWRALDDIYLVEHDGEKLRAAVDAVQRFCAATGMSLNLDKCGSIALRGPLPAGLPQGPVRSGYLILHEDGIFRPDEAAIEPLRRRLRALVERASSILEKAAYYSSYVRFVLRGLAPFSKLSKEHLANVGACVSKLHGNLFGEGVGIEEHLLAEIERRFLGGDGALQRFPRECLYWPLTAGGVGLLDPLAVLAPLHASKRKRIEQPDQWSQEREAPRTPPEEDWRERERGRDNPWLDWYGHLLSSEGPKRPWLTPNQKAMLRDFYDRGAELRGEEPKEDRQPENEVDNYWQWIICLHGPGLLARFGTLRVLEVALVPRYLILQSKIGTSSLHEPIDLRA